MSKVKKRSIRNIHAIRPVEKLIHIIREQQVMIDSDLAVSYGVETRALIQATKRNLARFPEDFMFQLSPTELKNWRSQFVMSNPGAKMGLRRPPYVFTELGVAMLSSVLHSERAVQMNIAIMRAFVRLREITAHHKDLAARVEKLEHSHKRTGSVIEVLVEDIDRLASEVKHMKKPPLGPKKQIGYIFYDD